MEQQQRSISFGPGTVNSKNMALAKIVALISKEPETSEVEGVNPKDGKEVLEAELEDVNPEADESEYYTLEELEQLKDKSMAYLAAKFSHIRFKRNPRYKFKGGSKFLKRSYSSGSSSRGGHKSNMVDRTKFRCYNCDELGHFASDCKKPKQAKKDGYEKKEYYDELKR